MKRKKYFLDYFPKNFRKKFFNTLLLGICMLGFMSKTEAQIQFVYTSDAHYGITRARFQKAANVSATVVNGAMIAKMNNLTQLTFPNDGGVRSGYKVDSVDFVVMTGDIANRSETTIIPTLSASTCWSQFANDYINGTTLKDKTGSNSKLYLLPGNHDVSNAIGFYKTMSPLKDSATMVNIYNMMMPSPRAAGNYNYANEKIHYSKNIGGIHMMFVCMWPDSTERVWMANDLATVSSTTPVFIFTHDQPLVESKHLSNPNSPYTINSTNKFENLLLEKFKDGTAITAPSTIEQNGFASFVQAHPNIVAYFHGNDNQNNYYKYYGPNNNIAIDIIQVDSPMKGNISATDETKLSFQLITIDTLLKVMTVRECLYNTDTNNVYSPIIFGSSKTINFDVANYAQNTSTAGTKICSATDLHLMHPSLLVNDGVAFQTYLASDRKLIKESNAIMQELKNRIYEERPEIFLVPGDLTKDGEKISHQLMATYLDSIEMNGVTKVYVIPGNHDVNNVSAYSYDGSNVTKVDSVSPSDFKTIYNNFGYGEAVKTDTVSLSYLAKPKSKTWVLGIDVLEYDLNMAAGYPITEGKFKPSTYKWVLDRLKEAKDSSAVVLGMMHPGLTEHYTGQSVSFPEYVVLGWDTISKNFAKAGLKMMFTGHFHANDITKKSNPGNSSFVYDIETGSTVTWPCPYRVMDLKGDSILNVVTNRIQNINYNTNGMTFQNYALNYLNTGMTGIINYQLTHPPYSLDAGTAAAVTPHVVSAFTAHYAGDETIPASEQGFISYLNSVGQFSLASSLTNMWTDLTPSDNLVALPLKSSIDTINTIINNLIQSDYTVPSWTLFLRAKTAMVANQDSASIANMYSVIAKMKSSSMPYNIVMNINKDPKTKMAFNWFTNAGVTGGQVQIVTGNTNDTLAFNTPLMVVSARCDSAKNLNYSNSANGLLPLTGIADNSKKTYMFNKALVNGLTPNTQYSFRVGKNGAWSTIGSFKTAKTTKDAFSFVYFTDPQANTDAMFNVSQITTHAAQTMYPNANFWLSCGDLVESSGSANSEWEYEQFFETQQDIFMKNPFAPIEGNHDITTNKNFTYHFNTDSVAFDYAKATTPGSVYSYVYGDALFMHLTYENYSTTGYLDSLANWMNTQVKANPTTKWRIAVYHKTMYTGSQSHQSDSDGKTVRLKMGPVFDSLKVDLAFQGHDHVYEIIGPVKNVSLIPNAVSNQTIVTATVRDNVTGLLGGTFDVKQGTLFFLNNSAGKKKYEPRSLAQMNAAYSATQVPNYFGMFTGRFGQTGEPTFSNVTISTDSINISTYTVDSVGNSTIFDSYKIVKTDQDNTWNGSADNNWNKASNWSEGLIPTQNQNVIIPTNVPNFPTVSSPAIINNLTVQSNSTATASLLDNGLLTLNGNASIKCYLSGNKWHMISIPVQSATSSVFNLGAGQADIYAKGYSNGNWDSLITNPTTPLVLNKGYAVWADTLTNSTPNPTLTFTGTFNTGIQTLPTETGWNLIGNPFISAIDWNTLNLTNVNGQAVRVWNHDLQLYSTYSAIGGGVDGGNQYLSPMQAFFVKGLNTDGIAISHPNRIHNPQPLMKSANSTISNLLKIKAQRSTYTDEINIVYNTIATNGYDPLYDANKLFVTDINIPQVYSLANNNELAINVFGSLPAAIPMNIKLGVPGIVSLTASETNSFDANISIKLEDILSGTIQDLRQNPVYAFSASANENANRFILHFALAPNSINEAPINNTSIYAFDKTIYVNSNDKVKEISIYNMLGQLITSKICNGSAFNSISINKASAFYMVRVITDKTTYSEKVFIK